MRIINKLKKLCLWTAMASVSMSYACSGSDDNGQETPGTAFSVDRQNISFSDAGGSATFLVTSGSKPSCTADAEWCKVEQISQSTGKYGFSVTCGANGATAKRNASITISVAGETKAAVAVEQAGGRQAAACPLGVGWNLGNQMDAHVNGVADETCWGNKKATQATFNALRKAGFTSVRIPVTWMGHIGNAPGYKIEEAWMSRVAELVGYAEKAGLKAIINIHHDGGDSKYWLDIKNAAVNETVNTAVKEELRAVWTQIAERFRDTGDFLVFEALNEIHDGKWGWGANRTDGGRQYKVLNEWMQVFVDAVRNTGGCNTNRWLGVCGYCTNAELTMENLVMPTDKTPGRLMVSVHFYEPSDFTLECKYSEWGHTGAEGEKQAGDVNEEHVKSLFGRLKSAFADKGYPVYVGETGCGYHGTARAELFRKYYLEYIAKAARTFGLGIILWDNGATNAGKECHGYIDHATGGYVNNGETMIKAYTGGYNNNDAGYTLEYVYNNAPK